MCVATRSSIDLVAHVAHRVGDVLGLHQLAALLVDDLALVVHHVVELEQLLADLEVAASTFCCAFSSALLIQGWTIASPSLRPRRCSMPSMRSEPKIGASGRRRGYRKNLERPGSPWRPERPRSWLSMRRLSCRSVPMMNRPPASRDLLAARPRPRPGSPRPSALALLVAAAPADPHVGVAAELDVGAAAGHVGGDGHRTDPAGLGDDVRLLLVVAGVQHLVRDALASSAGRRAPRTSRSRPCRPGSAGPSCARPGSPRRSPRSSRARCGRPRRPRPCGSWRGWSGSRPRRACRSRRTRRPRSTPCRSCRRASCRGGSSSGR